MRPHFPSVVALYTCLLISLSQAELCHPHDKKVLLQIQKSFGGPNVIPSWENNTDCCTDWYGVECDLKSHRVIDLYLRGDELVGQIPPAIGDLPYLQDLDLHKLPNITGSIPPEITKLKQLTSLSLDWLNLTGPIPSFLAQLKKLDYINLAFNKLSGPIPSELGSLPNLGALFLSRNQLSGSIPSSLGNLPGNTSLYIDLSHNQLTGKIPSSLNNLNVTNINLSRNKLEGDASMLFGPNKTVQIVDLDRNQLEFNLSTVVFPTSLATLDVNHNKIYGSLPPQMTEIGYINVSYNRLCGQIPVGGSLQSFDTYQYLHNKCLCGAPLPACK